MYKWTGNILSNMSLFFLQSIHGKEDVSALVAWNGWGATWWTWNMPLDWFLRNRLLCKRTWLHPTMECLGMKLEIGDKRSSEGALSAQPLLAALLQPQYSSVASLSICDALGWVMQGLLGQAGDQMRCLRSQREGAHQDHFIQGGKFDRFETPVESWQGHLCTLPWQKTPALETS